MKPQQEKFFEEGKDVTAEAVAILKAREATKVAEKLERYIVKLEGVILFHELFQKDEIGPEIRNEIGPALAEKINKEDKYWGGPDEGGGKL